MGSGCANHILYMLYNASICTYMHAYIHAKYMVSICTYIHTYIHTQVFLVDWGQGVPTTFGTHGDTKYALERKSFIDGRVTVTIQQVRL